MIAAFALIFAQAAAPAVSSPVAGPAEAKPIDGGTVKVAVDPCQTGQIEPGAIVVCGRREGFRIDPDVLKARQHYRAHTRPRPPERMVDQSCQTVGPMGCINRPAVDLLAVAMTAATMVKKAADGENVGQMFKTTPQPDEYQLYLEAKREREKAEAVARGRAIQKANAQTQPEVAGE